MSNQTHQPDPVKHESAPEVAESYRIVLQSTPVVFARVDSALRYEWIFNPHPDFDAAAVIGKRDDELDSGHGVDELVKLKQRVLTEGVQIRQEITFQRTEGLRTYDITATPLQNESGQTTHVLTAAIDITRRKQAEEALRNSERQQRELLQSIETERDRLAAVLENLPVGVWLAAADGRLIGKNKQGDRIWAGDAPLAESIEEYTQYDAWYPHNHQRLSSEEYPVARALRTGEMVEPVELQIRRFDGTEGTILVSAAPIKDRQGLLTGVVGINVDITERKQTEDALRRMNELLEDRVEERSREVRSLVTQLTMSEQRERRRISHILHDDLQQRLYSLMFQLAILRSSLEVEEQDRILAMIKEIEDALKTSVDLTRNLSMDFSPPILHNEGLVEAIYWLVPQMEQQHGMTVTVEAEHDLPSIDADLRVLLFHIVRELLFNVVKHAGVSQANISLCQTNDMLRIEISDQGRGFDMNSVTKRPLRSNGLLQVKRRLELVGGRAEIEAYPEQGTRIILYCPYQHRGQPDSQTVDFNQLPTGAAGPRRRGAPLG